MISGAHQIQLRTTATSLFDLWGNDMGTGTTAFAADITAPTIISVEAVKDGGFAVVRFSEPVFTDNPASGGNPAVISGTADTDITYTNTVAGGTTTFSATDTGTGQSFLLNGTGSGNSYVVLALTGATAVADLLVVLPMIL